MPSVNKPTQVVLVTSRAEANVLGKTSVKDNIITVAWHMPTSFEPFLYAISVGKTRFSAKLISESKCFVVNFVSFDMKEKALLVGTKSGEHTDKFAESGLTKEDADKVDCPRIKEAMGYVECEVIDEIETGDHVIYIGKVVHSEEKSVGQRLLQGGHSDFTTTM